MANKTLGISLKPNKAREYIRRAKEGGLSISAFLKILLERGDR